MLPTVSMPPTPVSPLLLPAATPQPQPSPIGLSAPTQPTIAIQSAPATDTVKFGNDPADNNAPQKKDERTFWDKTVSFFKNYTVPYFMVAGGGFLAVSATPLHLFPGIGNIAAMAIHAVGAAIAIGGAYWGYKNYQKSGY